MGSVFLAELVTVEDPENSIGTAIWLDSSDPFLTAMKTLGEMLIFSRTQGFLTQDLFHSTSLSTWGSSGASKEAKFFKELIFLSFVRYFSAKIE